MHIEFLYHVRVWHLNLMYSRASATRVMKPLSPFYSLCNVMIRIQITGLYNTQTSRGSRKD